MRTHTIRDIGIIIIGLIVFSLVWALWSSWKSDQHDGAIACTADAKICPDGSYVGRIGPSCEFAPCPPAPSPMAP